MFKLFGKIKDAVVGFFKGIWNFVTGKTSEQEELVERNTERDLDSLYDMINDLSAQDMGELTFENPEDKEAHKDIVVGLVWLIETMQEQPTASNAFAADAALDGLLIFLKQDDETNTRIVNFLRTYIESYRKDSE